MKPKHLFVSLTFSALALFGAQQSASAAGIAGGDTIKLFDSYGASPGGEFTASILTGSAAGGSFQTFCLEYNEYFDSYGQTLYVKAVNVGAVRGGVTTADNTFTGPSSPTSSFDPISYETAYLYMKFSDQTLSNFDFGDGAERIADGTSLQRAIWFLEGEGDYGYSGDLQAQDWVSEAVANTANWTDIGSVRVLNLYKDAAFTQLSQDQLYIAPIPEPEIYAMLAAGLGLMGFVVRRRSQRAAA